MAPTEIDRARGREPGGAGEPTERVLLEHPHHVERHQQAGFRARHRMLEES